MQQRIETAERPTWLQRKYERDHAPIRECHHCGMHLPADQMEPLYLCEQADPHTAALAGPSDCCKSCWQQFRSRYAFMQLANFNIERKPPRKEATIQSAPGFGSRGDWIASLKSIGLAKKDGEGILKKFYSILDQRWIEYYV